jgi:hypothetical protein
MAPSLSDRSGGCASTVCERRLHSLERPNSAETIRLLQPARPGDSHISRPHCILAAILPPVDLLGNHSGERVATLVAGPSRSSGQSLAHMSAGDRRAANQPYLGADTYGKSVESSLQEPCLRINILAALPYPQVLPSEVAERQPRISTAVHRLSQKVSRYVRENSKRCRRVCGALRVPPPLANRRGRKSD